MRKIMLTLALIFVMALAACTSGEQAGDNKGTSDNKQAESTENKNKNEDNGGQTSDNKQDGENKEDQTSEEKKPARFDVYIEDTTFEFKEANLAVPFKVAKNGKPFTGGALGLQVALPLGSIPFTVEEVGNGNYEGKVRVPEPGVYDARVFKMEDHKMNILGTFKLEIK